MTDLVQELDFNSKKRFLKRYRQNRSMKDRLIGKIENLDHRILSLSSPKISDMPRGVAPVSKEDMIAEKCDLLNRVKRLEDRGRIIREEIIEKIDELEDCRYAEVLELFLIDCYSFEEIADITGYTTRHIARLYSEGIESMSF